MSRYLLVWHISRNLISCHVVDSKVRERPLGYAGLDIIIDKYIIIIIIVDRCGWLVINLYEATIIKLWRIKQLSTHLHLY